MMRSPHIAPLLRRFVCMLCLLPCLAHAQGYIRVLHEDVDMGIEYVEVLESGDIIASASTGAWVCHLRDLRLKPSGEVIWRNDTALTGMEFQWRQLSLGDSLFFEAGNAAPDPQTETNPYMRCFDAQGRHRWLQTYGMYQFDQFIDLALVGPNFLVGLGQFSDTLNFAHTFLQAVDGNGSRRWRVEMDDTGDLSARGILYLGDGKLLCGLMHNYVPRLVALDTTGTVLWQRDYPEFYLSWPFGDLHLLPGGGVLSWGEYGVIQEFTADGDLVRGIQDSHAVGMLPTADGGMVTHGMLNTDSTLFVRKYDSQWNETWYREYDFGERMAINSIDEAPDGDLVMGGHIGDGPFFPFDGLLIRTDCEGRLQDYRPCNVPTVADYVLAPNPATDKIAVIVPQQAVALAHRLEVFDLQGRLVAAADFPANSATVVLPLTGKANGLYLARMTTGDHPAWEGKVRLQR